jgi:CRISPR/Cas system-associated exonuclease Cas4 (RecB family)
MAALEAYGDEPPSAAGVCFLELDPKMEDLRNSVIYTPGIAGELIEGLNRRSWECGPKDLENFRERIRNIDLSIRSGRFPRASKASNCGPCAFRNLCFRDEHRLKAMDTGVS